MRARFLNTLVARFNEGVALMKACWTEPEITFDGRFWQLDAAAMEPKPAQRPHPPDLDRGSHPAALRRPLRVGDGFFGAGSQTTSQFAEQMQVVRDELAQTGRESATFSIAKRVYIHVDDDRGRARERIETALARHYGRGGLSAVAGLRAARRLCGRTARGGRRWRRADLAEPPKR